MPVPPAPGQVEATEGGAALDLDITPQGDATVQLSAPGFAVDLGSRDQAGSSVPLANGVLSLPPGGSVALGVSGYYPGSRIGVYLDPSSVAPLRFASSPQGRAATAEDAPLWVRAQVRASMATLGTLDVDDSGSAAGSVALPASLAAGAHSLQLVGGAPSGAARVLTLGVEVPASVVTPPGAVADLRGTSPRRGAIALRWAPPASDGGSAVTGYRIVYRGAGERRTLAVSADAQRLRLRGLAPGKAYRVAVRAVNSAGAGAAVTVRVVVR